MNSPAANHAIAATTNPWSTTSPTSGARPITLDERDFPRLGAPAGQTTAAAAVVGTSNGGVGTTTVPAGAGASGSSDLRALTNVTNTYATATATGLMVDLGNGAATSNPTRPTPVTVVQGVAASMHAPHNRQPSPTPLPGPDLTQLPTSGQDHQGTQLATHNRFEPLSNMSPAAVEELVRPKIKASKAAKGKGRAQKRRRTESSPSSEDDEPATPRSDATETTDPPRGRSASRGASSSNLSGEASPKRPLSMAGRHLYRVTPTLDSSREPPLQIWFTEADAEAFRRETGCILEIDYDAEQRLAGPSNAAPHEDNEQPASSITPKPTPARTTSSLRDRRDSSTTPRASVSNVTSRRPPSRAESSASETVADPATPTPRSALPLFLPSSVDATPSSVAPFDEQDVVMFEEDPLFSPDNAPVREQVSVIPFTRPTAHHPVPEVNHPDGWYDNITGVQVEAWRNRSDALLVRIGGEGYATQPARRRQLSTHIVTLISEVLGPQPGMRVSIPSPHHPVTGAHQPPFSYLLWGLTANFRARLLELRYFTCDRGILFFTPNRPQIPRYLASVSQFSDADPEELREHFQSALTTGGINQYLYALAPAHPELSQLPVEEAVERLRNSFQISIVRARQTGGAELLVAHLHMDSPTDDPVAWTSVRSVVEAVSYAHPLLGMEMGIFRDWRCRYCHSSLHPSGMCHLITEPGWIVPPAFHTPVQQALPAIPVNPIQQTAPAVAAYSTVAPPQNNRGGFNGNRGRGRGAGGRGRGRGH